MAKTGAKLADWGFGRKSSLSKHRLPIARVVKTYPGSDGLVRVVDVFNGSDVLKRAVQKLSLLLKRKNVDQPSTVSNYGFPAPEDVRA